MRNGAITPTTKAKYKTLYNKKHREMVKLQNMLKSLMQAHGKKKLRPTLSESSIINQNSYTLGEKDEPQPQVACAFGLVNTKRLPIISVV